MPIKVRGDLLAKAVLERKNIFVMNENRAMSQDIRPLEILILNLMPIKEKTRTQLLQAPSNTPLQVDYTFLILSSYISKNTSTNHLNKFYMVFVNVRKREFGGMIITGAPVEHLEYGEVSYWEEPPMTMEWTKTHVTSTIYICQEAQAGLCYHYGAPKYKRDRELSGAYRHRVLGRRAPLVRSMDDHIMTPHSRCMEVCREDIEKHPELVILAESLEASASLVADRVGKQVFVRGHPGYDRITLNEGYYQDLAKDTSPGIPYDYYKDDDPFTVPVLCWRNVANTLYTNWLNFYVYQGTPYNLDKG